MVWHNKACQEEGLNVFNFPDLAWLVRVSRVVADSFLREIVTLHLQEWWPTPSYVK